MRSFNFKMVLNNVSINKHMHYCIQKIYHMYYTTQWNFIILRKFIHMTLASPNGKMNEGFSHSKTFLSFSFKKERILL